MRTVLEIFLEEERPRLRSALNSRRISLILGSSSNPDERTIHYLRKIAQCEPLRELLTQQITDDMSLNWLLDPRVQSFDADEAMNSFASMMVFIITTSLVEITLVGFHFTTSTTQSSVLATIEGLSKK